MELRKSIALTFALVALIGIAYRVAFATPISVPSAPSAGYALVSTTTGAYVSTTTSPLHVGSLFATSSAETSIFNGNVTINGTCTGCGSGISDPFTHPTFAGNVISATSTLVSFTGGLVSFASTTVGNGTMAGGLTIAGGATTTYATTTSLAVTGVKNAILGTDGNGSVIASTSIGYNYISGNTTLSATSPLTGSFTQVGSGGSLAIQAASATQHGYLALSDYTLLHAATTTFSAPLTYTVGTNAVTCAAAGVGTTGCLSSTDWGIFNNKVSSTSLAAIFPFTPVPLFGAAVANATSTLIGFTQGIYSLASTTIGNGTITGGLTVAGTASSTNLIVTGSSTMQVLSFANSTSTNATTTTSYATTASSTNEFTTNLRTSQLRIDALGTALVSNTAGGNVSAYAGASSCAANNFFTGLSAAGASTCGTASISGVNLGGNLAAHTVSGSLSGSSYNGSAAISDWAINLANVNTWTGSQTFSASTTAGSGTQTTGLTIAGGATTTLTHYFKSFAGIGTTTPQWSLQIATSTANGGFHPQLAISDSGFPLTNAWTFANESGFLYLATTTNAAGFATSTKSALTIDLNSRVGIGTTSPTTMLTVEGTTTSMGLNVTNYAQFQVASTSLLNISGLGNTATNCLQVTVGGVVQSAGAACGSGGSGVSDPFTHPTYAGAVIQATSTLVSFTGGLVAHASTTIGNGTQTSGLVIAGGATTTLNAYFASKVGIGTSTPNWPLSIAGNTTSQLVLEDSTNLGGWAFRSVGGAMFIASTSAATLATSTIAQMTFGTNGYIGFGTTTPAYGVTVGSTTAFMTSAVIGTCQPGNGGTSTSMTIDWRNCNENVLYMGNAAFTITFVGIVPGATHKIDIVNPTTGQVGAMTITPQSNAIMSYQGGIAPVSATTTNSSYQWQYHAIATSTTYMRVWTTLIDNFQ